MRLAVITQVLDRRDAVLGFFHTWCSVFAEHVERLTVYAQFVGDCALPDNVDVVGLGRDEGRGKGTMLRRLGGGLLRRRPDAVWVHMVPKFVLYAAPFTLPRRVPMFLWYTHKGVDRALRMAAPMVRRAYTASEESFRLPGHEHRKVVTGHGIDTTHFALGELSRAVDVLTVGRLAPSKGQDELLDALALMKRVPVTEIAGDVLLGRDVAFRSALEARARELAGTVRLLGAVPYAEIGDVMRRARVMVNASRTGSVDKVVLEAMACGTLPLTCNESFVPILGAELSELLMFRRDEPEHLAERLSALLEMSDPGRAQLGERLRAVVTRDHDVVKLIPRIVADMNQAIGRGVM